MKIKYFDLKNIIKELNWDIDKLSSRLSVIGHEAEPLSDDIIDVKLTANRKDCQDIKYLAFDLIGLHKELGSNDGLISYKHGKKVRMNLDEVNKILGSNVTDAQYRGLERLGFRVESGAVTVPDFRKDIFEGADIAEEVFRMVGPSALKIEMLEKSTKKESISFDFENSIRAAMSSIGASETKSISFSREGTVKVKNPFSSSEPFLRKTLLPGLLHTVSQNPFIRKNLFYEIGNVFTPNESTNLGIIITGNKKPEKVISSINSALGMQLTFSVVDSSKLEEFSVKQPNVLFAEIGIRAVKPSKNTTLTSSGMPSYKKISKFPPLVRDISIPSGSKAVEKIQETFESLLFSEMVDSYTNPQTKTTTDTYRLFFQSYYGSFTNDQIKDIDSRLSEFI